MIHLRRPLVVALLCFTAGLVLSLRFPLPLQLLIPATAASLLVAASTGVSAFHAFGSSCGRSRIIPIAFGLIGCLSGATGQREAVQDCRVALTDGERLAVSGSLGAAHRPGSGPSTNPLLPLTGTTFESLPGCTGEVRVRFPLHEPSIPLGAQVDLAGEWREFTNRERTHWPGDPRFSGFIAVQHVISTGTGSASLPLRLRRAVDERIESLFPRQGEMMEALVLGRREYVSKEVLDRYARSGLTHLLAISGMHVGLIAAALLLISNAMRLNRRKAVMITIAATWLYLLIIGAAPSALRSGIMITLALTATILQRPSAAAPIVAAAALAILAFQPLAILDPGFQLSFAGILAILFFRAPLLTLAPDKISKQKVLHSAFEAFVLGIAAFVVTAPIVAHHFGVISPISIPAGVPAIPLVSLALIGSVAALAIEPLLPALASLIADGAGLCLDLLDTLAALAASIPYGNSEIVAPPWWSWGVAAAVGATAGNWKKKSSPRLRWLVGSGSSVAVLVAWPATAFITGSNGFEVHFIDVGQGDAIALRTPHNRWLLIDAGPASAEFDAGARQVVPFLRAHGARGLDALILTHPDLDHIGGAPAVLDALPVAAVFEPGHAVGKKIYEELLSEIDVSAGEWRAARSGRSLELDGIQIDFLWPDTELVDAYEDANQISSIMRISYGDFSLLLTGDAGVEIEEILMDREGEALAADVLKLGHHGSSTSTAAEFLDLVVPQLAIVSAGRRNRYGHPAAEVMERVQERSIPVARTDLEGSITLLIEPGGSSWRREEW